MTPLEAVVRQTRSFLPSGLLMLAAGLAAALIAAYITTARNFGHIAHIISVLGEAERGVYPAETDPRKSADEYDAILNNIIRLHLETERLNSELEQKKHLQEVASLKRELSSRICLKQGPANVMIAFAGPCLTDFTFVIYSGDCSIYIFPL